MSEKSPLVEAQQAFSEVVPFRHTGVESSTLGDAMGRTLADDLPAPMDMPPYSRAIVEGFLVHTDDTEGASEEKPITFQVVASVQPGDAVCPAFDHGQALRIATGSLVPEGKYSAVRPWDCETQGEQFSIKRPFAPRFFLEDRGCDFKEGDKLLAAGSVLGPAQLGTIASVGITEVNVARRPVVTVFSSGDEVIPHTEELTPGAIYDSNSVMLSAAVTQSGGEARFAGIMGDDFEGFVSAARNALQDSDMILISGGTAVGGRDFIADLVKTLGELLIDGVPMRSGRPLIMGLAESKPIVCVAGHPPEALRGFDLFGQIALDRLLGRVAEIPADTQSPQ